jgi:DNA-binding response OmpR family regulator
MAKILLVEDDTNLQEIYSARFMAESYDVITANDGEEALATAVRERPDLIVLDVMMPKISGFDVLDILRSTPETKDTKVIMMTALSQDSDRLRGENLGVNKYLIKSQVTLEDVVNAVKQELAK